MEPRFFEYESGQPAPERADRVRTHDVELGPMAGTIYVYATFEMGSENSIPQADEKPQVRQFVSIGQGSGGEFVPAVRFGLHDRSGDVAFMTTYLFDGQLDYYGMWLRPGTPYDFKLRLDLDRQRMNAFCCGRGDDDWFLLAENAPLINPVTAIDRARVEQGPGSAGISNLSVLSKPLAPIEEVQPHPLAKQDRVVGQDRGYRFQCMRSTWRKLGKQVTVLRKSGLHFGFPDVAQAGLNHLICVCRNGSHTGGNGHLHSICHSPDLGQSWSEPTLYPGGEYVQSLRDGTLLAEGVGCRYCSVDGGTTWTKRGNRSSDSHVLELADSSWLAVVSAHRNAPPDPQPGVWYGEKLQFHRSTDRGHTWEFWSELLGYPPYELSEASMIELPDGRLLLFAREVRMDGFPAVKAYSSDKGKTWEIHELPFAISGRAYARLLSDGRAMVTFRSMIGRPGLWAWVGDPLDTTSYLAVGAHFNDRCTVALKDGGLHIDNDGVRGQLTQYLLRQPDSEDTAIDVTVEVKAVSNNGRAATLSVPWVGKFRFFPDTVEFAHNVSLQALLTAGVTPGEFHTYRVVKQGDTAKLHIDGELAFETDKVDQSLMPLDWIPTRYSANRLTFGNEPEPLSWSAIHDNQMSPDVTGYSIWRRAEVLLDDPKTGRYAASWSAKRDGFPDQYQLDHIIEVDASVVGSDQGYSGWVELDDGRISVVNYTDDTAPMVRLAPDHVWPLLGIPWIRGTYLLPSDLPPLDK